MYTLKNRVQLIGQLGRKPEIRYTEKGKKCARFCIATSESYRNNNGEKVLETHWHNLIAWGRLADLAESYLSRGGEVAIEGKLLNRLYTGKDGKKRYVTEVLISEILLLDARN